MNNIIVYLQIYKQLAIPIQEEEPSHDLRRFMQISNFKEFFSVTGFLSLKKLVFETF